MNNTSKAKHGKVNKGAVELGQAIDIISGAPFKSELFNQVGKGLPLIRVRDVNTGPAGIFYSGEFSKDHFVKTGDLLVSMDGDFKAVRWAHGDGVLNQRVCKIVPKDKVLNSRYLEQFLPKALSDIHRETTFTTVKHLSVKTIREIQIPLPPLDDQIRIAHLLGKVEGLIAQRKQHLKQLDDLLRSVFLEMFGDPVRNEKGWDKKPCSKVAEIITGHPFKSETYTEDPTQIRLCGGLIIYPQRIEWEKCNFWPKKYLSGLERYFLEVDDIVLAMDRPWISSGLKICTVDELGHGALLVQRTARLRANDVEQLFLYAQLKDSSFTKHCKPTETTVPHISIKDIQTFQVLCPPKQLQIKFSSIAKKIGSTKSRYQKSLVDLENLYGALSQQAFKGELDLSNVPLSSESKSHAA